MLCCDLLFGFQFKRRKMNKLMNLFFVVSRSNPTMEFVYSEAIWTFKNILKASHMNKGVKRRPLETFNKTMFVSL